MILFLTFFEISFCSIDFSHVISIFSILILLLCHLLFSSASFSPLLSSLTSHPISSHLLHLISTPSSLSYYPIPSYLLHLITFISSLLSHRYYFSSNLIIVFPSHSLYLISFPSFPSFLPFPSSHSLSFLPSGCGNYSTP